jgi:hypothetical protein
MELFLFVDDETVCLFDVRYMNHRNMLHRTGKLGGGIWRIKWHPYSEHRVLVAAMHGGCRVINFGGGCFEPFPNQVANSFDESATNHFNKLSKATSYDEETVSEVIMSSRATKKFTEHESIVYGADWMVCRHPTQNGYFEAAGRCVALLIYFSTSCGANVDHTVVPFMIELPIFGTPSSRTSNDFDIRFSRRANSTKPTCCASLFLSSSARNHF